MVGSTKINTLIVLLVGSPLAEKIVVGSHEYF